MIKAKIGEVYDTRFDLFGKVNAETGEKMQDGLLDIKFRRPVALELTRIAKKLEGELKLFEQQREELIKEYGELNEKGEYEIKKTSLKFAHFVTEYSELSSHEVELQEVNKIKVDDMTDGKGQEIEIEPILLLRLYWLLEI